RRPIPMTEPAPVVLVIDDEIQIRRFLRAGLELDGFVVQEAETGTDAMRAVTLTPPDLVILDLGLPDMDGADVLERLRAWSNVPLIVHAVRRRVGAPSGGPVVRAGPLSIDLAARFVTINGERVILTPKEYRLLQILAQHAGNVVTHQFLLKEIWGSPHIHDTHYLRIFVRKLRQKIEADPTQPHILVTELGIGYRLALPEPARPAVA